MEPVSRAASPEETFRREVGDAFAFLIERAGFCGPESTENRTGGFQVGFHRPELHIKVNYWPGREATVSTTVERGGADDATAPYAYLACLYVVARCGPAQHVPESAPTPPVMLKRVHEHAAALRRLLPILLTPGADELFVRCWPRRQLPED
jgi:hypothetical protein